MRDGFRDIVAGWTLIDDVDALKLRIDRAANWTEAHAPLQPDEEATIKLMIETVIMAAIKRGDFVRRRRKRAGGSAGVRMSHVSAVRSAPWWRSSTASRSPPSSEGTKDEARRHHQRHRSLPAQGARAAAHQHRAARPRDVVPRPQ